MLVTRYVTGGKPIALIDGNQPGLGKTLLVRILSVLADGTELPLMPFTANEDELHKTICGHLRAGRSVLGIDNAKVATGGVISSPALESLVSGSKLALRILGKSELFERPTDLLWALTMNDTRTSPDLVSRGLPIRLEYAGDPAKRVFRTDPVAYAEAHRLEILGELAGMVNFWNANGRRPVRRPAAEVPRRHETEDGLRRQARRARRPDPVPHADPHGQDEFLRPAERPEPAPGRRQSGSASCRAPATSSSRPTTRPSSS